MINLNGRPARTESARNDTFIERFCIAALALLLAMAPTFDLVAAADTLQAPVAPVRSSADSGQAAGRLNLDLGSTVASVQSNHLIGSREAYLNVAGTRQNVSGGAMLTPAQAVALAQVLRTGQQNLALGAAGNAIGGSFIIPRREGMTISNLSIPFGVTAISKVSTAGALEILGSLVNSGSLFSIATTPNVTTAVINAASITNQPGGLISTNVPASWLQSAMPASALNLALNAGGNFFNAGSIISTGSLSITAGGTITNASAQGFAPANMQAVESIHLSSGGGRITNSGQISSTLGNVLMDTGSISSNLVVQNALGTISALAGTINVRNSTFAAMADTSLIGGNFFSKELNIFSGKGMATVDVDDISGLVNTSACAAHIVASAPHLRLGALNVSGDPFVANNGGDLDLSSLTFPVPYLVATASGSIFTSSIGTSLDSSSSTANGGNMVLAAGVIATDNAGVVTLTRSGAGGDIRLTAGTTIAGNSTQDITGFSTNSSKTNGNGGNITLIALADSTGGATGGHISLPANVQVNSQGKGTGSNGNVTVIAEASSDAIGLGSFGRSATAFGTGGGGNISVSAATPNLAGATIDDATGTITGSFGSESYQNGGIAITGPVTAAGTVSIYSPQPFIVNSVISGKNVSISTIASNADIQVGANIFASSGLTLRANGSGQILGTGTLQGSTVNLVSTSGDIGSSAAPLTTSAATASLNTGGSAFITNWQDLGLSTSAVGGTLKVGVAAGGLSTVGSVSGNNIQLSTTGSSGIRFQSSVTATGSDSSISLSTQGGPISSSSDVNSIAADSIVLTSSTGNIGNSNGGGVIVISGGNIGIPTPPEPTLYPLHLSANSLTINTSGAVNVLDSIGSGTATINASSSGKSFTLASSGSLITAGGIYSPKIKIQANDTLTIGNTVGNSNSSVTLITGSGQLGSISQLSGSITSVGIGQVQGNISIFSGSVGTAATPLAVVGSNLASIAAANDVYINNAGTATLSVGTATVGGALNVSSAGAIDVVGAMSANRASLTAGGSNGAIQILSSIAAAGLNSNISLIATGSGAISQGAHTSIAADSMTLVANTGSISLGRATGSILSVGNLLISSGGDVSLTDSVPVTVGNSNIAGALNLVDKAQISILSTVTAGSALIETPSLVNQGALTAGDILIRSPSGSDLSLSGVGAINASGALTISSTAGIDIAGSQTLSSATADINITTGANSAMALEPGVILTSNVGASHFLTVTTGMFFGDPGNIVQLQSPFNQTRLNIRPDAGLGIIANPNGQVDLTNGFIYAPGKNLIILARGNIYASALSGINTSAVGTGGSVSLLAGFDFSPTTTSTAFDKNSIFHISGPSPVGGSIFFGNVPIVTSSLPGVSTGSSGDVLMIANAGTQSAGVIVTNSINTSSPTGTAGSVRLYGAGGVTVKGPITTTGKVNGGAVTIYGAQANFSGPTTVSNGFFSPGTIVSSSGPVAGSGAALLILGSINTSSTAGSGGAVRLSSELALSVLAPIITSGQISGGSLNVDSLNGTLLLNSVNTSGYNVFLSGSNATAGSGGNVAVSSPQYVLVTGDISTAGGMTFGTGAGGNAGSVDIITSTRDNNRQYYTGNVSIGGAINATGGNAMNPSAGTGGAGGNVTITAGSMQINGLTFANGRLGSLITSGGSNRSGTTNTSGLVRLTTYSVQSFPADLDLTSAVRSVYALPGSLFVAGAFPVINGTRGDIVSGSRIVGGGSSGNGISLSVPDSPIQISVLGQSQYLIDGTSTPGTGYTNGIRNGVTPAEAVALYQKSHGLPQTIKLNPSGQAVSSSTITVPAFDLYPLFFSFVLATTGSNAGGVTLNITGENAFVNLSATAKINISGTLNFTNGSGLIATGPAPLNVFGAISAPGNRLTFQGLAPIFNSGTLSADQLLFLGTGGSVILKNNPTGQIIANSILLPGNGIPSLFNFVNRGFVDAPISLDSAYLPTAYGTASPSYGPASATLVLDFSASTIEITGSLGAKFSAITIIVPNVGPSFSPPAGLLFTNANLITAQALVINSVCDVNISNSNLGSGGVTIITAPGIKLTNGSSLSGQSLVSVTAIPGTSGGIFADNSTITSSKGTVVLTSLAGNLTLANNASISSQVLTVINNFSVGGLVSLSASSVNSKNIIINSSMLNAQSTAMSASSISANATNGIVLSQANFMGLGNQALLSLAAPLGAIVDNGGSSIGSDNRISILGKSIQIGVNAPSSISANAGADIRATGGALSIDGGSSLDTNTGMLLLQATTNVTINATLTAGSLSGSPAVPLVNSDIAGAGSINIVAGLSGTGILTIGNTAASTFTSHGKTFLPGDIKATSIGGGIILGTGNNFTANGGNIVMLTNKDIVGASGNHFSAYGVALTPQNTAVSVGGGIELGAGTLSSQLLGSFGRSNHISPPASKLSPTHPGSITVANPTTGANSTGVVQVIGTGTVNLATSGTQTATLSLLRGGALVFDSVGGAALQLDGAEFTVSAYRPIAHRLPREVEEHAYPLKVSAAQSHVSGPILELFVPGHDSPTLVMEPSHTTSNTPGFERASTTSSIKEGDVFIHARKNAELKLLFAKLHVRRDALVLLTIRNSRLQILNCGLPGSIELDVDGNKIALSSGEEVLISEVNPGDGSDGLSRRHVRKYVLSSGLHVRIADLSLPCLLNHRPQLVKMAHSSNSVEKRILERVMKTAAALQLATATRGAYLKSPALQTANANLAQNP